ncbi:Protein K08F8.5, isoform b [Aphelenchoides fujianensis]|nr:Protein K08F8.5, isoform b [Aphelenchoides fujianensis]
MTDENEVATPSPVLKVSEWRDFREGDEFPDSTKDREYSGRTIGPLQILVQMPSSTTGFTYDWRPFKTTMSKVGNKEWHPVHLSSVAPCVLLLGEYEVLGSANLKEESAQTCVNGRHVRFVGREIHEFSILCRKVCHETMEI